MASLIGWRNRFFTFEQEMEVIKLYQETKSVHEVADRLEDSIPGMTEHYVDRTLQKYGILKIPREKKDVDDNKNIRSTIRKIMDKHNVSESMAKKFLLTHSLSEILSGKIKDGKIIVPESNEIKYRVYRENTSYSCSYV